MSKPKKNNNSNHKYNKYENYNSYNKDNINKKHSNYEKRNNIKYEYTEEVKEKEPNKFIIKLMTFTGTVLLCLSAILLMKYFFVDKNNLGTNYSTDKQLMYITLEGQEELISTQKYMSDLGYNMRYDIERFSVFKYKNQDIYRFKDNFDVVVLVEKSEFPAFCNKDYSLNINNCYKFIDDTKDEYYITNDKKTYRVLVKTPSGTEYKEGVRTRISYMINSFEII